MLYCRHPKTEAIPHRPFSARKSGLPIPSTEDAFMQPQQATSKIELRPWEDSDTPIAFLWMEARWHDLADDFSPKDIDVFVENKRQQCAMHLGVWRDGELVGMLTQVPISPILCDGHAVFRPSIDPFTAATAIRLG